MKQQQVPPPHSLRVGLIVLACGLALGLASCVAAVDALYGMAR